MHSHIRALAKVMLFVWLLLFAKWVFAASSFYSLGGVASHMTDPLEGMRHVFNVASILLGVFLLLAAFNRYMRHRQNPIESPLGTVILWAVLGILLIIIPIAYQLSQEATMRAAVRGITN